MNQSKQAGPACFRIFSILFDRNSYISLPIDIHQSFVILSKWQQAVLYETPNTISVYDFLSSLQSPLTMNAFPFALLSGEKHAFLEKKGNYWHIYVGEERRATIIRDVGFKAPPGQVRHLFPWIPFPPRSSSREPSCLSLPPLSPLHSRPSSPSFPSDRHRQNRLAWLLSRSDGIPGEVVMTSLRKIA